uniref:Uncharacterized protein n=1 Tax=Panagrolaimus sp. ES5 TaxID=591445 RepID=A0AC34FY47_9BILA
MATKEYCLPFNDKQKGVADSVSDDQYSSLNLNNQNHKCVLQEIFHPKSISSDNKEGQNYVKQNSWTKPSKYLPTSVLYNNGDPGEGNEIRKPKSINNSTLSIHITAYENSVEASFDADYGKREGLKKKWEKLVSNKNKQLFNSSSASNSENPFQFPRQQENEQTSAPELLKFKASQKLLHPNTQKVYFG